MNLIITIDKTKVLTIIDSLRELNVEVINVLLIINVLICRSNEDDMNKESLKKIKGILSIEEDKILTTAF